MVRQVVSACSGFHFGACEERIQHFSSRHSASAERRFAQPIMVQLAAAPLVRHDNCLHAICERSLIQVHRPSRLDENQPLAIRI